MNFLVQFCNYDVFIVCDKNTEDFQRILGINYPKINFIQIVGSEAAALGFTNSSQQTVNSWDKALYYFSRINTSYDNVWLIEDDVYFHSEQTLLDIDTKFGTSDLLTNALTAKYDDMNSSSYWHWSLFSINLPEPHFRAMVCATRISKALFRHIDRYATTNKTLFYLEALFPTIAKHHGLKYDFPQELSTIEYCKVWNSDDINTSHLFHPVKNLEEHNDNRLIDRVL